ncbi:PDZ domain-containing protein [Candidatus Falkowbacteria bacterium]|nr:PDZ domain-containing protein [Candidatus Falkowbacteria bacterium]
MEVTKPKNFTIALLIVPALLGLAGGVVGQIFAQSYFLENFFGLPGYGEIDFSKTAGSNLVISGPKKVIVQQNDKIAETTNSIFSSLAGIYPKREADAKATLGEYYKKSELQGQALILSSDGWLVTSLALDSSKLADSVVVLSDKKIYSISQAIQDKLTGLYFLKIDSKDLPVKNLADYSLVQNGQLVLATSLLGSSRLGSVINTEQTKTESFSTDRFDQELVLDIVLRPNVDGPAVFDLAGEIIGIIDANGKILPSSQLAGALSGLLLKQKIERPSLGLEYVDYGSLTPITPAVPGQPREGALIVKPSDAKEIKNGFKEGDLITFLSGKPITTANSLNVALQAFAPGEKVEVDYWREGKEHQVSVRVDKLQ